MGTFDILRTRENTSANGSSEFDRWIPAIAVIGSILAMGLVVKALAGPNFLRSGQAATQTIQRSELSTSKERAPRSGTLLGYQIVF